MVSYYLTPDAAHKRSQALKNRLCAEAINLGPGGITWMPESDYWMLPKRVQEEVAADTMAKLKLKSKEHPKS